MPPRCLQLQGVLGEGLLEGALRAPLQQVRTPTWLCLSVCSETHMWYTVAGAGVQMQAMVPIEQRSNFFLNAGCGWSRCGEHERRRATELDRGTGV